mgnify:CR=1 FL=1
MNRPNYLEKGSTIAIVSSARKLSKKELEPAMVLLKQWGLKVVLGKTIDAEDHQFAGNDELRTSDFQEMLDDPNVKAIWFAKGGYGTVRIIDQLNFSEFIKNPKWIIGYSDITVLHSHIHGMKIETLHAQMPVGIDTKTVASSTSIKQVLFGETYSISYISKNPHIKSGNAKGTLVGGNLSILYSLCGSPSAINTDGKILFIEDLDEYLYHIDRMLQNLKRNGMFDKISGLIVGGMSKMNDNTIPFGKTPKEMILEVCEEYDFPIAFNFPAGHVKDNRALIMGREVEFEVNSKNVTLAFKN